MAKQHPYDRMPALRPRYRRNQEGRCRWCACTEDEPCDMPCGWAPRSGWTLCTNCTGIETAWRRLQHARLPNMRRAFFLGFLVGAEDPSAPVTRNPYSRHGRTWHYFEFGRTAGQRVEAA